HAARDRPPAVDRRRQRSHRRHGPRPGRRSGHALRPRRLHTALPRPRPASAPGLTRHLRLRKCAPSVRAHPELLVDVTAVLGTSQRRPAMASAATAMPATKLAHNAARASNWSMRTPAVAEPTAIPAKTATTSQV